VLDMVSCRAARWLCHLLLTVVLLVGAAPASAADADSTLLPAHAADRIIVGFEPNATRLERRRALAVTGPASPRAASPIAPDVAVLELGAGQPVASAIGATRQMPGVSYAEPDYRVWTAATADDPYYLAGEQWGAYGDATVPHANPFGSGAGEAWSAGHVGASSIIVGIIDEGVAIQHPELADNIWRNPAETVDGVDEDGNGYVDDVSGWDFYHDDATVYDSTADDHGTHVAGTIGARGGNGVGVAGVNWRVSLIAAKFMGPDGGYVSDAIRALDYITDLKIRHGLDIVATNNSWSGGGYSRALNDAIDRGGDAGILFITAAGNEGRDIDASPAYPAAYRCVKRADDSPRGWDCAVAVANLRSDGELASDSNRGATGVDLAAPGSAIISTSPVASGSYARLSGTSMAAAHTSGAVALCASVDPSLPAARLRELLLDSGSITGSLVGRTVSQARLDIGALVAACAAVDPPPAQATVEVDDLDMAFHRFGSGWHESADGYRGHHFWAPTRDDARTLYGTWKPLLDNAGWYEILVHIPVVHATSRRASYRIKTSSGWVTRVRNQQKRQGTWVSLGSHHLSSTPIVQLADRTDESVSLARSVAFDAARFVSVGGSLPELVRQRHYDRAPRWCRGARGGRSGSCLLVRFVHLDAGEAEGERLLRGRVEVEDGTFGHGAFAEHRPVQLD
jgi:subtilisin family serine protease